MAGSNSKFKELFFQIMKCFFSSKYLCDGAKNAGPKVEGCQETDKTLEMMKDSCHGDYHCQVDVDAQAKLPLDPRCFKPKKELKVQYICGML